MSQVYSQPERETDPHALPDVEVFYVAAKEARINGSSMAHDDEEGFSACDEPGWYWWSCFPGCLPDSVPDGPYATEQEAIDAAQSWE